MGDAEKKPRRRVEREGGEDLQSWWFPRDGEPVRQEIPEHVREQIIKRA